MHATDLRQRTGKGAGGELLVEIAALLPRRLRQRMVMAGWLPRPVDVDVAVEVLHRLAERPISGGRGVYVEAGALDGVAWSNTLRLERLGWRGLLIEPSPPAFAACRRNRAADNIFENCALVGDPAVLTVRGDFDGAPMSSIEGSRRGKAAEVEVPARTLQALFDLHGLTAVDFVSLDVEGSELDALGGIDFSRCRPRALLVEVYERDRAAIEALLARHGYAPPVNLSRFTRAGHPFWDGTHNDFLFELPPG